MTWRAGAEHDKQRTSSPQIARARLADQFLRITAGKSARAAHWTPAQHRAHHRLVRRGCPDGGGSHPQKMLAPAALHRPCARYAQLTTLYRRRPRASLDFPRRQVGRPSGWTSPVAKRGGRPAAGQPARCARRKKSFPDPMRSAGGAARGITASPTVRREHRGLRALLGRRGARPRAYRSETPITCSNHALRRCRKCRLLVYFAIPVRLFLLASSAGFNVTGRARSPTRAQSGHFPGLRQKRLHRTTALACFYEQRTSGHRHTGTTSPRSFVISGIIWRDAGSGN